MKNIMKKLIVIMTILMMFNINLPKESLATEVTDEFAELLTTYESEAPSIESAELSTTFTSNKEVEVYIKTSREDVNKVTISAWSGGPYEQYLVSKEATYDELRNVYTVLFPLNEIVNTTTNQIENASEVLYYFDACIYSTNGSMSYVKLDEVEYTESGIKTQVTTNEEENQVIEVKAEEDGYVAIVNAGEEVTEETEWQPVTKGVNTYALPASTDEVQNVQVLYKAGAEVTEEDITNGNVTSNEVMLLSTEETEEQDPNMSYFQDDETFTFEFSQNSGANDWIAYTDTPNVLESTIQGMHGTEAVATIKIKTEYPGVLSFDYMVSSEETFDTFSVEITGATMTTEIEDDIKDTLEDGEYIISGQKAWENYIQSFATPEDGIITITLKYSKDFNVNRPDDKAAIRNLTFEPVIPEIEGTVVINNGAEFTNNTTLNLTLNAQSFTKMYITDVEEKPDISDANWQSYQNTVNYTLKDTADGLKTVYVYYMNESGAITIRPVKASIKVDTSVPTTVAPTVESTANTVTAYLNQTDANEFTTVYYGYRLTASGDVEYTWSENVRVNDLADVSQYTISGLTEMQEYEVVTKVSDGVNGDIVSEVATIKTKIPSDGIVITKSTEETTLGEVVVNIEWNNTEYTKEYSLDGINWTEETADVTTITLTENATIYYRMKNDAYDTGILECEISNIDHGGPQVEKIEVIEPVSGTYGIDDEITLKLTWNEEATVVTAPTLNIKFEDNNVVSLTAVEQTSTTLTYKYTIVGTDAGYLSVDSLTGGFVKDNLNNEATYVLPELTGSKIFVENMAYIASTNKYYGTLQRAINAAGTETTTIKLIANNVLRDTVVIKEGQNIVLDLNGKTVSYESEENIVTAIENRGTLEIYDSTAEKAGLILASSKTKSAYTIVNNPTGNLTIKDIKVEAISESTSVSLESYALYNKGAGTIILGTNDSDVSVIKPELKATSKNSYGLYIANAEGNINYYDGIIKGITKAINMSSSMTTYNMPTGYLEKVEFKNENGIDYEVAYLSNESAVELTMNGITTGYKSILEAIAKVPTDGRLAKIKILTDETLEDIVKIYKGQNVEIDLNGHVLTRTEDIGGYLYALINNGTLKISDTSEEQTGEIRAIASKDVTTYAVYNYTDGNLTIDGGKYFAQINTSNKTKYAYGLESNSTNNIIINGGEIFREQYFFDSSNVETPSGKYLNQRYETINGIEYKVNYISENPMVEMTTNNVSSYYSGIQQAINNATTDGTLASIKMLQNEEVSKTIEIVANKTIEIDLNNKTIKANELKETINNNGTLKILDTSIEKHGKINVISNRNYCYGIYNDSSGTLEICGCNIIAKAAYYDSTSYIYGIYNKSINDVIVNDSIIDIYGLNNGYTYGIWNNWTGNIEINNTDINIKGSSHVYGISNKESGNVKVNSGTINSYSYSDASTFSYGIYNNGAGNIEINEVAITATACTELTGGWSYATGNAYGIYNNSEGNLNIFGGLISSSASTTEKDANSFGIYIVSEDATVHYVDGELKGKSNGIYIPENMNINNIGTVEKGKVNIPENNYISYRIEEGYIVNYLENGTYIVELTLGESTEKYFSIQEALSYIPSNGERGKIKLLANESLGRTIDIKEGQNVEIDLNGKTINASYLEKAINNNGVLIIRDSSLEQQGKIVSSAKYVIYNSIGSIEINNISMNSDIYSTNYSSSSNDSYGIYNADSGDIKINSSIMILGSSYAIYNASNGNIEINETTINSTMHSGIYNMANGNIIINNSIIEVTGTTYPQIYSGSSMKGIYNNGDGSININKSIIDTSSYYRGESSAYCVYNNSKRNN